MGGNTARLSAERKPHKYQGISQAAMGWRRLPEPAGSQALLGHSLGMLREMWPYKSTIWMSCIQSHGFWGCEEAFPSAATPGKLEQGWGCPCQPPGFRHVGRCVSVSPTGPFPKPKWFAVVHIPALVLMSFCGNISSFGLST